MNKWLAAELAEAMLADYDRGWHRLSYIGYFYMGGRERLVKLRELYSERQA